MAKRRHHVYTGMYTRQDRQIAHSAAPSNKTTIESFQNFINLMLRYIWTGYSLAYGNYLALATIIAVVLLSFLIPDISKKMHATTELNSMKKVLDVMTEEVNRAEAACLTTADEICYLQCSMQDGTTETQLRDVQDLSVCTSECMSSRISEPVQVEREIGIFQRIFNPHTNTSHKEIAIMSYLYTDSFNVEKTIAN
ncbi:unnamed protein product [Chilo suppressalis]|uniref:Uncharacterized protein n=1 Tax=Chilo suppressalis TaxID=168631 RepID=A0ABN8AQI8_CHISP|nr:unnamed protein product [Chilo suppressalis]